MAEHFASVIRRCWRCGLSGVQLFKDPLLDYPEDLTIGICAACVFTRGVIKNRHIGQIEAQHRDAS